MSMLVVDGTTVNIGDLAQATVRLDSPNKTHNNLGMDAYSDEPKSGKSYSIPIPIGHFEKIILPLRGLPLQMAEDLSTVGILVVAMEEDNTSVSAANAGRKALVNNLQKELTAAVRSAKKPNAADITEKVKGKVKEVIKEETLKDWWTPWGLFDAAAPDDIIGSNFATFTYTQILNAGNNTLPISLDCKSKEGHYTITGRIGRK